MPSRPSGSPYLGPRSFGPEDHWRFFGRTDEVNALRSLVLANRLVVVHARSGCGKTSIINAGLIPSLEPRGIQVLPVIRPARPQTVDHSRPLLELVTAHLDRDETHATTLQQLVDAHGEHDGGVGAEVLLFDQFEEIFTSDYSETDRSELIELLATVLEDHPSLRLIISIRDEFMGRFTAIARRFDAMQRTTFDLPLLGRDQAYEAITRPLEDRDVWFATGVAEALVEDLAASGGSDGLERDGRCVEPVQLQVVCESLWQNLPVDRNEITATHLRLHGRVDDALDHYYRHTIESVAEVTGASPDRLYEWVATKLVTSAGTRSTVFREDAETAGLSNEVVAELEHHRIVRSEDRRNARWYELTHDRLVPPVQAAYDPPRQMSRRLKRALVVLAVVTGLSLLAGVVSLALLRAARADEQAAQSQADAAARLADLENQLLEAQTDERIVQVTVELTRSVATTAARVFGEEEPPSVARTASSTARSISDLLEGSGGPLEIARQALIDAADAADAAARNDGSAIRLIALAQAGADNAAASASINSEAAEAAAAFADSTVTEPPNELGTRATQSEQGVVFAVSAASFNLIPPMELVQEADERGSEVFIRTTERDAGSAYIDFAIEIAGDYEIWGLVTGANGIGDSFYLSIDSASLFGPAAAELPTLQQEARYANENVLVWDLFEQLDPKPAGWVWDRVSTRCGGTVTIHRCNPLRVDLGPGAHRLGIHGREAGSRLAEVVITHASSLEGTCPVEPGDIFEGPAHNVIAALEGHMRLDIEDVDERCIVEASIVWSDGLSGEANVSGRVSAGQFVLTGRFMLGAETLHVRLSMAEGSNDALQGTFTFSQLSAAPDPAGEPTGSFSLTRTDP